MNYRINELVQKLAKIEPETARQLASLLSDVSARVADAELRAAASGEELARAKQERQARTEAATRAEEQRKAEWDEITKSRHEARDHARAARAAEARIMVPGQTWNSDAAREVGEHQYKAKQAREKGRILYVDYCMKWGKGAPGRPIGS